MDESIAEIAVQAVTETAQAQVIAETAAETAQQAAADAARDAGVAIVASAASAEDARNALDDFRSVIEARFSENAAQHAEHVRRLDLLETTQTQPDIIVIPETEAEEETTDGEAIRLEDGEAITPQDTLEETPRARRFRRI